MRIDDPIRDRYNTAPLVTTLYLEEVTRMAEGIDDAICFYHLSRATCPIGSTGSSKIELADEVRAIEQEDLAQSDSKRSVIEAIESRCTMPS